MIRLQNYVHVHIIIYACAHLLHTYDITIGKFIYTGCVTIVMLHTFLGSNLRILRAGHVCRVEYTM